MADLAGFDVSQWQAGAYAGGGGFSFGWAKASEGVGYADPSYQRHISAIRAHGLVPGAYHFARPDLGNSPENEADWFLRVVGDPAGMLLALDLEVGSGDLLGWRDRFCGHLEALTGGYACGWYTYWSFALSHSLNAPTPYWGWLAWPDANGPMPGAHFSVSMQQWGLTSVPGIAGQVDANRFPGSLDELRALTVGGGHMALDPNDPVIVDLRNRLGGIQYFIDPGSGASGQGEITQRLRDLSGWLGTQGDIRGAVTALAVAQAAVKSELDALSAGSSSNTPPDLTALRAAVATADGHVAALGKHLGMDVTAPGAV